MKISAHFDHNRKGQLLLLAGIALVALNLRPAIVSVSPVLQQIRLDLGLNHTVVSLLTVIPTFCLGVFAFAAPPLSHQFSRDKVVLWATVCVGIATLCRLWGANIAVLFITTFLIGVGVAVTQTLLPAFVKEYFPERAGSVTGLYMACLLGGSGLASAFTVLASKTFNSWPASLAIWCAIAILAALLWLFVTHRLNLTPDRDLGGTRSRTPWKQPEAWMLALLLFGVVFIYFAELTWLAPFYIQLGWSAQKAGFLLTASIGGQIAGALLTMVVSDFFPDRRPALIVIFIVSAAGLVGSGLFPLAAPWLWVILMGLGMGGASVVSYTLPVDYSPSARSTVGISAMVLGLGYFAGALGPLVLGWMRDMLGGYKLSFLGLGAFSILCSAFSLWFRPGRMIEID